MIERTQGSWQAVRDSLDEFSDADCRDVGDAIRAFAESVVLPEAARRTKNRLGMIDYKELVDALLPDVAAAIIGERSLSAMLKVSRAWHNRMPALDDFRTIPRTGSWEKATPDFTASNGYVIAFLDTGEKLRLEGKTLHHCVGGYTERCKQDRVHIASIRKPVKDGEDEVFVPVSTVEFEESPDENLPLRLIQHRGDHDATPPVDSPNVFALNEFMARIGKHYNGVDKIRINFDKILACRAEIAKDACVTDVRGIIGYDPFVSSGPKMQDEYFRMYLDINSRGGSTQSFVPGGTTAWKDKTAQEFLVKTGLMKSVDRLVKAPPLLRQHGMPWP